MLGACLLEAASKATSPSGEVDSASSGHWLVSMEIPVPAGLTGHWGLGTGLEQFCFCFRGSMPPWRSKHRALGLDMGGRAALGDPVAHRELRSFIQGSPRVQPQVRSSANAAFRLHHPRRQAGTAHSAREQTELQTTSFIHSEDTFMKHLPCVRQADQSHVLSERVVSWVP